MSNKTPAGDRSEGNSARPRVSESLIHNLRLDIATGKTGSLGRLPSERALAEQYQVGRGTVREAIRALELIGLVHVRRGREGGIFTTANAPAVARASFTSFTEMHPSFPSILEFRRTIEPRAAALAAVRATKEQLHAIQTSITTMQDLPDSPEVFIESNRLFHDSVALASGNPYIHQSIAQLISSSEVSMSARKAIASQRALALFFHQKIAEAILARDPREAETWMDAHFSQLETDFHRGHELTSESVAVPFACAC